MACPQVARKTADYDLVLIIVDDTMVDCFKSRLGHGSVADNGPGEPV